jgi:hypothetical protein
MVPDLPPGTVPDGPPRQLPEHAGPSAQLTGAVCDLAAATEDRARAYEAERTVARQQARERERGRWRQGGADFDALARHVVDAGDLTHRPREVGEAADRAYRRAYGRELRQGKGVDAAKLGGIRSRRACLGAWGKCLARAGRVVQAPQGV